MKLLRFKAVEELRILIRLAFARTLAQQRKAYVTVVVIPLSATAIFLQAQQGKMVSARETRFPGRSIKSVLVL